MREVLKRKFFFSPLYFGKKRLQQMSPTPDRETPQHIILQWFYRIEFASTYFFFLIKKSNKKIQGFE